MTGIKAAEHFDQPGFTRHAMLTQPCVPLFAALVGIGKQGRILRVLLRRFDAQPPERDAFLNLRIADFVLPDIAGQLPIRLLPGQKQPNLTARYVVLLRLISRPSNRIKGMFQP